MAGNYPIIAHISYYLSRVKMYCLRMSVLQLRDPFPEPINYSMTFVTRNNQQ